MLLTTQKCIQRVVEHETQDSAEIIISPDPDQECETLIINFQKLSISSAETNDAYDPEWISHNTTICNSLKPIEAPKLET